MGVHGTSAGDPTRRSPRGKKQPGFLQSWGWKTPWFGARSHAPVHARWNWEGVPTPHLLLESLQSHRCCHRGHREHPVQAGPVIPARNAFFPKNLPLGTPILQLTQGDNQAKQSFATAQYCPHHSLNRLTHEHSVIQVAEIIKVKKLQVNESVANDLRLACLRAKDGKFHSWVYH